MVLVLQLTDVKKTWVTDQRRRTSMQGAEQPQVELQSVTLAWALCGRGVFHALLQGVAAVQSAAIAPETEVLTSYGTGYDFLNDSRQSECPLVVRYLQHCPDFRSGGPMALINASDALPEDPDTSRTPKRAPRMCRGTSYLLGAMHHMSLSDGRLVRPVSQEAQEEQHAGAPGEGSLPREVLESMFRTTGVKLDNQGRLDVYIEMRRQGKPDIPAALKMKQNCLWDDAVAAWGGESQDMFARGKFDIRGDKLEHVLQWYRSQGVRSKKSERPPQGDRKSKKPEPLPQVEICGGECVSMSQFDQLALNGKQWAQKVMVRGGDGKGGIAYFALRHFLNAALHPEGPHGRFRKVDGRFVRATMGGSSPWIHWMDGGASAPVGNKEERLLLAIDSKSAVERFAALDKPFAERVIRDGWKKADLLRDKLEEAVGILMGQARYAELELEHADVRQALCWYTPDTLLQACTLPRLGWWIRTARDFLRAVWEPTVATALELAVEPGQALRNVAILWGLEHRCTVELRQDEPPSWQSTDLYLLATVNAINSMMLEMLDPSIPQSPLRRNGALETRLCAGDKGFGLYATRELPYTAPPETFVDYVNAITQSYSEEAPEQAVKTLVWTARLQLQRELESLKIAVSGRYPLGQQLLLSDNESQMELRGAHEGAEALAQVAEAVRLVGAIFCERKKRRRRPDNYDNYYELLRNVRSSTSGIPREHRLRAELSAMIRSLRFCSSLQLLAHRSKQRRKYQADFARLYASKEKDSVLPLGFMRGAIQGVSAPTGGRAPSQHANRLAVAQLRTPVERISYDFHFPCIDRSGRDVGTPPYRLACSFDFTAPISFDSAELIYHEQLLRWAIIADRSAYPGDLQARCWTDQYVNLVASDDPTAQAIWQFAGLMHHHGDPLQQVEDTPPQTALGLQGLHALQGLRHLALPPDDPRMVLQSDQQLGQQLGQQPDFDDDDL
jgi:hypothetical protein